MRVPAGLPVFIEESFESFRRIQLEGTIESVWIHGQVVCSGLPQIFPINFGQPKEAFEKIKRLNFRPCHIAPGL
jgi:hypothetical protein